MFKHVYALLLKILKKTFTYLIIEVLIKGLQQNIAVTITPPIPY